VLRKKEEEPTAPEPKTKKTKTKTEPEPEPEPDKPEMTPKQAADKLYRYAGDLIRRGRSTRLGTTGKPNREVKRLQGFMKKLKEDGQYGPKTRARGKELLGKDFPVRKRVAKDPLEPPIPPRTPPDAPPAPPPPAPEPGDPLPKQEKDELKARSPQKAAEELRIYVKGAPKKRGRARALGFKNNPSMMVMDAQQDMGKLKKDGIYGNKTRARGKELTGQSFPRR